MVFIGGFFLVTGAYSQEIHYVDVKPEVNVENSLYAVVYLKYFPEVFSYSLANEYKTFILSPFEFNNSFVYVEFLQAKGGITQEQRKAYFNFLENEKEFVDLAKNAIYFFYQKMRLDLLGVPFQNMNSLGKQDEMYPQIVTGNELKDKIRLYSVKILQPHDGESTIVLDFAWTIEQEGGLYVHFRDNKFVKISDWYEE
jgi:hypothetical protein